MKLAISNIAWSTEHDDDMYQFLRMQGFAGLEVAPTRLFPVSPYKRIEAAVEFAEKLKTRYGLVIASMQSIWHGRQENIFGSDEERAALIDYTKQAVDFSVAAGCGNLVFGCAKNRNIPDDMNNDPYETAADFFREITAYAAQQGTIIALEANPQIYGTNFINRTEEAFAFVRKVGGKGFAVNLDIGTMVECNEAVSIIESNLTLINHIHISEPHLAQVRRRTLHTELRALPALAHYGKFISIEMSNMLDIEAVKRVVRYVGGIFA
ncbi:MAG: sugar phosphate isomerase/epimerase [Desulfovibrio sp.]|jgi:sugar phosphate isomerase/epimerase|nr:sugar phosphate isomerase/epimerase [Desulfovibrio sp.]